MFKVIVIFVVAVCVIMVLFNDKECNKTVKTSPYTTNKDLSDLTSYSTKHSRSIQDDIKKVVNKNI